MKRLITALFVLFGIQSFSQPLRLSEKAEISIITCGPSNEIVYSAFGHSAFRVVDPEFGIDYAFNYGVFDFDKPNFYLNFAKGRNYYLLAVYDYENFEWPYVRDNRFVHEQVLNLTQSQKEKIFSFLLWNAKPENRSYRYDYYQDNCATKIRDVLVEQLGDDITIDSSFLTPTHSFRQKTDEYLEQLPWGDLGIDICLGFPIDRIMSAREYMFLPDYIESFVDHTTIKSDSLIVPLVKEKRIINQDTQEKSKVAFVHPWIAGICLFIIVALLSIYDWRRKKISKWLDVVLFGTVGLVGLLLATLWLLTDHHDAARNFNLLWAFPLHFFAAILLLKKNPHRLVASYFLITGILLGATLLFWWLLPQQLNVFLIPIVGVLLMRAFLISTFLNVHAR
jgi:hypothetical protein